MILSANQAYYKAIYALGEENNEINNLLNKIEKRADEGNIFLVDNISSIEIIVLEELGYKVKLLPSGKSVITWNIKAGE